MFPTPLSGMFFILSQLGVLEDEDTYKFPSPLSGLFFIRLSNRIL